MAETDIPKMPWWESNLLWGPVALGAGIIIAVVAAMKQDLRWLLWFSLPCFLLASWAVAKNIRNSTRKWLLMGLCFLVFLGVLGGLNYWLRPKMADIQANTPQSQATPKSDTPTTQPIPKNEAPQIEPKKTKNAKKTKPSVPEKPSAPEVPAPGDVKQGGDGNCQANSSGGNATVENSCNTGPITVLGTDYGPIQIKASQLDNTIRIETNRRIDQTSLGLFFNAEVDIISSSIRCAMNCVEGGRFNDPNGVPDKKTIWLSFGLPAFTPDNPIILTVAPGAKLLQLVQGPKMQ